ncbi:MAG: YlxR family protein [Defluviitaleaceae bacterium]|nr:YlxR family protein [Defluviitaleaceae bacterium]MCL2261858.1 YlxR family protein [Defluviitaleaceae bacterium]
MKSKPQRRCVACREMKDKSSLIRITATAEGEIQLDPSGKAPGRGAYICRDEQCMKKAHKIKGLERSLKRKIPSEVYAKLLE